MYFPYILQKDRYDLTHLNLCTRILNYSVLTQRERDKSIEGFRYIMEYEYEDIFELLSSGPLLLDEPDKFYRTTVHRILAPTFINGSEYSEAGDLMAYKFLLEFNYEKPDGKIESFINEAALEEFYLQWDRTGVRPRSYITGEVLLGSFLKEAGDQWFILCDESDVPYNEEGKKVDYFEIQMFLANCIIIHKNALESEE